MKKLGFIGTGNLAASVIKGLTQRKLDFSIYLYDVITEKADALAQKYNAQSCSFAEVVKNADILFLAVKPKDVKQLLQDLSLYRLRGK
jgi:pyrroline-5-carboxylate reductase